MRSIFTLILAVALLPLVSCASIAVDSAWDGKSQNESRHQTGIIGMFADDIHIKHDDGSCVSVTWGNRFVAGFFGIINNEVSVQKPCRHGSR